MILTCIQARAANSKTLVHNKTPIRIALEHERRESILAAVRSMMKSERFVLERYFFDFRTIQQIADELGVSRARVCQVKNRALHKLYMSPGKLRDYLNLDESE